MKTEFNFPWGTWRGRYAYDSATKTPMPAGVFTMRLNRGWWFGRVVGFCIDHEPPKSEEPSRIFGWIKGGRLSFEKRYRTTWVATPQGTKSLREWLTHTGFPTDTPLPGQRVFYEGRLEHGGTIARGTWRLTTEPTIIRSKEEDRVLAAAEASGSWIMKRIDFGTGEA